MPLPGGIDQSNVRVWVWVPDLVGLSNNDTPATLPDQSGNGNDLEEGTGPATYKTNIINGLPVLEFNGTDSQYTASYTEATERITYFHVMKHLSVPPTAPGDFCITTGFPAGANKVMLGMTTDGGDPVYVIEQSGTGGAAHEFFGTPQTSTFVVHRQRYDTTDRAWEDGVELDDRDLPSSAAGNNSSLGVKLGSREDDNRYWHGQLVGFMVAQGLTDQEEQDVEAELMSMLENVQVNARVSRVGVEILSSEPDPQARVSRVGVEVLSQEPDPVLRVSRIGVEVLQSMDEEVPTYSNLIVFELDDVADPGVDTDHFLRIRARTDAGTGDIRYRLFEDTNEIATFQFTPDGTMTVYEYELLEAEAAAIGDYTDLQAHIDLFGTAGFTPEIDWVRLDRPASELSAVGDAVGLLWDIYTALGDTSTLRWDLQAAIGDTVGLVWDDRAAVGDNLDLLWDLFTPLGDQVSLLWDAAGAVGDELSALWDIRATLGDTTSLLWDLHVNVGDTSTLRWDIRQALGDSVTALWDVGSGVSKSLALLWDDLQIVMGEAFPTAATVRTAFGTETTSHLVNMPASVTAGQLLILIYGSFSSTASITDPSGWTPLAAENVAGMRLNSYYKIANGTEGGTTVDVVTSAARKGAAHVYQVSNWHGTTPPEAIDGSAGTTDAPDPPALAPSWGIGNTLWIAVAGGADADTVDSFPTDYTNGIQDQAGEPNGMYLASAQRAVRTASENPGPYDMSTSAIALVSTIAVRSAIVPTQISARWDQRSLVGDELQLVWDSVGPVGDSIGLLWDILEASGEALSFLWDVRTPISDVIQLLWDLRSPVGDVLALRWDVAQLLAKAASLLWDITTSIGDQIALLWDAKSPAATSTTLRWDISASIGDQVSLLWDAAVGDQPIGKAITLLWFTQHTMADYQYRMSYRSRENATGFISREYNPSRSTRV